MSIATYLTALDRDRDALAANLVTKGVQASSSETFTSLVPKVLDIPSGDSTKYLSTYMLNYANNVASGVEKAITELTVKDIILTYSSGSTGYQNAFTNFSSLKKITLENVTFPAPLTSYFFRQASLEEVTIKNCSLGSGTTNISYFAGVNGKTTKINIDGFDVSNTTTLSGMFQKAGNVTATLTQINGLNTLTSTRLNVNTSTMFSNQSLLQVIDLSGLKTASTSIAFMFNGCSSLTTIDISGLDCTGITNSNAYNNAFGNVPTTCTIYVKDAANQAWFSSKFSGYTFTIKT